MGYYYTSEPEAAPGVVSCASPKTHTPGSPVKERGHRYYMPEVGRWTSRDPIGEEGGINLAVYLVNDSKRNRDRLNVERLGDPKNAYSTNRWRCGKWMRVIDINHGQRRKTAGSSIGRQSRCEYWFF